MTTVISGVTNLRVWLHRWEHPANAPGRRFESEELGQVLKDALAKLSENHRQILLLREVEGMSYEDIAEAMDCHLGTVMSRLHHARKNLQKTLKPYLDASGSTFSARAGAGVRKGKS